MRVATIILIAASFFASPLVVKALNFGDDRPTVYFVVVMPVLIAVGIIVLFGMKDLFGGHGDERQLKIFRLSSYSFLSMGIGALFFSIVGLAGRWEWVFLICIGVGAYLGVFVSGGLFAKER